MQSAFPVGTVLRERYVVQSILGQGGMGRTYKAIDQERFNEPCVIKEFIPPNESPSVVAKARELFQREASILYQISHPQVPQFRAAFEMAGRLFLVQDYVEGKTFRDLLDEHGAFSEGDIVQLLQEVLPILSYLHSKGIIHRDISPENLMLRGQDNLPVLIDFGVVQASQMGLPASTIAGKPGYAPPEQLQSGNAYASSDLYALAVTALVLLTDREPGDLFDHRSLSWHWQEYAEVSAPFAQILDRMTAYKPAHRYASADEVFQALKKLEASKSQVRTYAVIRQRLTAVEPDRTAEVKHTQVGTAPQAKSKKGSSHRGWQFNWIWGVLLVILSGISSWAITSILFDQGRRVTTTPTETPTQTPTPTASPVITNINRRLDFSATSQEGQTKAVASDKILEGQTVTFRLSLEKGQTVTVAIVGAGIRFNLKNSSLRSIDAKANNNELGFWQGTINESGTYFLSLETAPGIPESTYNLEVTIDTPKPKPTQTPTPTPTPTETPTPTPTEPLVLSRELTLGATVGDINSNERIEYSLAVAGGQNLSIALEGNVQITVYAPDGSLLWNAAGTGQQLFPNTAEGTYRITVTTDSKQVVPFQLNVNTR